MVKEIVIYVKGGCIDRVIATSDMASTAVIIVDFDDLEETEQSADCRKVFLDKLKQDHPVCIR